MTRREKDVLSKMVDGAFIWWMDTKAMTSQYPALCHGRSVETLRRPLVDSLEDQGFIRQRQGLHQLSFEITEAGIAAIRGKNGKG